MTNSEMVGEMLAKQTSEVVAHMALSTTDLIGEKARKPKIIFFDKTYRCPDCGARLRPGQMICHCGLPIIWDGVWEWEKLEEDV